MKIPYIPHFYHSAMVELGIDDLFLYCTSDEVIWKDGMKPSEDVIAQLEELKIRLESEYPIQLLREERNKKIEKTDWEIQRNNEMGIDNTDLINYRIALRNLPQEIEAGNLEKPYFNELGELVFDSWPRRDNGI